MLVRGQILYIKERVNKDSSEIFIREFDLYEVVLEILEEKGFLEKNFAMEAKKGSNFVFAAKRLEIFESNQSYVTDQRVREIIASMEKIVKHSKPYDNIQKLPGLYKDFDDLFVLLLEKECEPIGKAIDQDLKIVMEELAKDARIKDQMDEAFRNRFSDLKNRLQRVNNFYEAIAMQTESDRLKVRCIDEINREMAKRNTPSIPKSIPTNAGTGGTTIVEPPLEYKQTKTISKSTVLRGTKTIENEDDIETLLNELRKELQKELKENTIIRLV